MTEQLQKKTKKTIRSIIRKLKICDPIEVSWVDAGDDEKQVAGLVWKSMNDSIKSLKEIQVITIGFFHCFKAQTLFLFNNHDTDPDDPQIACEAQIPVGCIKSIRRLRNESEV